MKKLLATAIAIIGVCFAWSGAGDAATADASLPRCDWVKVENSSSGVRLAQIDHCCVGVRTTPNGETDCAFACNTMVDSCTGILIRAGYGHIAFDGYTPEDCIGFILDTPYC